MNIKIIFTPQSPYKKRAVVLAIIWTILILIGCFTPAKDIPDVPVPLIDKWVHFILFGGVTFLWLCTKPSRKPGWLLTIFLIAVGFGISIEVTQGILVFLGRSAEVMDAVADAIGGALGVGAFYLAAKAAEKEQ